MIAAGTFAICGVLVLLFWPSGPSKYKNDPEDYLGLGLAIFFGILAVLCGSKILQ